MNRFKDLIVWQEAIDLAVEVYQLCKSFPKEEKFGLISQLQRASVSVSTNIAEGAGRNNPGEFNQFLGIAQASLSEVESLLILSSKLKIVTEEETKIIQDRIMKIHNMLFKLKQSIKKKSKRYNERSE